MGDGDVLLPLSARRLAGGAKGKEHAMAEILKSVIAVIGIDIGKTSFHVVGFDGGGAVALRQKWSRGQVEARLANMPPRLIGMEACVGAHHLSRRLRGLGHDARLMPAKYVRPYAKGQKNDSRDADAIAEAVQRPTMKFVVTKTPRRRAAGRLRDNLGCRGLMPSMSAKGSKADIWERAGKVTEVPIPEVIDRYSGRPALR
jgi:hypothetical protein